MEDSALRARAALWRRPLVLFPRPLFCFRTKQDDRGMEKVRHRPPSGRRASQRAGGTAYLPHIFSPGGAQGGGIPEAMSTPTPDMSDRSIRFKSLRSWDTRPPIRLTTHLRVS
jgi:hypothetical protein